MVNGQFNELDEEERYLAFKSRYDQERAALEEKISSMFAKMKKDFRDMLS